MLIEEIDDEDRHRDSIDVRYGSDIGYAVKMKRSFDSIFTDDDIHLALYDDIKKFIDNKETYKKLNYPYKYSALLYGDPGAGKSSTILAIASALNRNVEYVNLATSTMSSLIDRLNKNTNNSIYVFEDVDALTIDSSTNRETSSDKSNNQMCVVNQGNSIKMFTISLSDLLNITDGLLSSDGAICIFTTNHIEKLDPALLRAGRMNKIIKFAYLSAVTATKMAETYLGYKPSITFKDNIKPAELQEELLSIVLGKKTEAEAMEKFRS